MRKIVLVIVLVIVIVSVSVCSAVAQKYHVTNITRSRILVDSKYADDAQGVAYLKPYKAKVDSVFAPVVGVTAKFMKAYPPESELSNLLADIMVWCGTKYGEKPDIGIYNMGGIRASLPAGKVTFGDVTDVAPFENKIYFMDLTGQQVLTLMQQIADHFGAGISHGLCVTVKNRKVQSVTLNGEPIDPQKTYRVATLDYLAQGTDGMKEFANGTNAHAPKENEANTRYLITEYFREKMAKGEVVDANVEGRVKIEN